MDQCKVPPYKHQLEGIEKIVSNPFFMLGDEMGAGKTLQSIVAAQILYDQGIINRVLVVCPATVRSVWFDPELGELKKHLWDNVSAQIIEFHGKNRSWWHGPETDKPFFWVITNYDYLRSKERLPQVLNYVGPKTLLILDESSAIKNSTAKQSKMVMKIRKICGRVLLLNGTPIANNPMDLLNQGNVMHPSVLNCPSKVHFRARYAEMGGYLNKEVILWKNIDDLQKRFAPYVLRRLKIDCLDLPEKMPPVSIVVPLDPKTWNLYKEMKEEMLSWLTKQDVAVVQQAAVKAMRLVQICAGFLGGVEERLDELSEAPPLTARPAFLPPPEKAPPLLIRPDQGVPVEGYEGVYEVGREKLDLVLNWFDARLEEDPKFKLLIWCRFRPELGRFVKAFKHRYGNAVALGEIRGGQKRDERDHALRLLDPRTTPDTAVAVFGTPASGSMGLNLTAAHTVLYTCNDHNLKTRLQSMDRVHRPGQRHVVSYFDLIASGPKGQKTIDHVVLQALNNKEEIATWTTSAWVKALKDD